MRAALTSEDQSSLDTASRAFVNGLSAKVPQSAVDTINATRFPMKATVVTAQDIDITGRLFMEQTALKWWWRERSPFIRADRSSARTT